jgi:hypothetical protein
LAHTPQKKGSGKLFPTAFSLGIYNNQARIQIQGSLPTLNRNNPISFFDLNPSIFH